MTDQPLQRAATAAERAGIRRIQVVSYRDLDDALAGGSEVHLHEVIRRWAAVGLDVSSRTVAGSCAPGHTERAGYRIERRGGYRLGMPRTAVAGLGRRFAGADALVEVWNGFPAWSPVWWRGPRLTVLHHLHGHLWDASFPAPIAVPGRFVERRIAPWLYRRAPVATLSGSSADELAASTALLRERIHVVPPGVHERFRHEPDRPRGQTVLTVARLTSAKRVDVVIRATARARAAVPGLRLEIVGDGPERAALTTLAGELGLGEATAFLGQVDTAELVERYQSARLVASASSSEGWGMTISEAAACGTPAVVSDIVGHRDALARGAGVLVDDRDGVDGFADAMVSLLDDDEAWTAASRAALAGAADLSWDATAGRLLELLVADADRTRR